MPINSLCAACLPHFEQYGPVLLVGGSYERSEYGIFSWFHLCGIYGYIKMVDVVMSHEGSAVSLSVCDFKSVFSFY
jgi:hypothetical protein